MCLGYFVFFMLLHETDFLCFTSRIVSGNYAQGFSCAIRDKIIVRENNRIAKRM